MRSELACRLLTASGAALLRGSYSSEAQQFGDAEVPPGGSRYLRLCHVQPRPHELGLTLNTAVTLLLAKVGGARLHYGQTSPPQRLSKANGINTPVRLEMKNSGPGCIQR